MKENTSKTLEVMIPVTAKYEGEFPEDVDFGEMDGKFTEGSGMYGVYNFEGIFETTVKAPDEQAALEIAMDLFMDADAGELEDVTAYKDEATFRLLGERLRREPEKGAEIGG